MKVKNEEHSLFYLKSKH